MKSDPGLPLLVALLVGTLPVQARAQGVNFWEATIDPSLSEVEPLVAGMRAGLASSGGGMPDRMALETSLELANRARALRPRDPLVRRLRGRILYAMERWSGAAEELTEAIRLDPRGPLAHEAAFDLGVALTRLDRPEEAAAAYELYLEESPIARERAIALTNLAETLMGLGRLEEAVARFREALSTEPRYPHGHLGLAVALDRTGDGVGAHEAMMGALGTGAGLASLDDPAVFFVPSWEIHYYRALAHEVLGQSAEAQTEWRTFLALGGDEGPFADRAREHLTSEREAEETAN